MAQYPAPGSSQKFAVTKVNTAGEFCLTGLTPSSASTSSSVQTYGSWAQVTGSSAAEYYIVGLVAKCTIASSSIAGPVAIDVGVGGAGSETAIGSAFIASTDLSGASAVPGYVGGIYRFDPFLRVSAGSRISVRAALQEPVGVARTFSVYLMVAALANVEGN